MPKLSGQGSEEPLASMPYTALPHVTPSVVKGQLQQLNAGCGGMFQSEQVAQLFQNLYQLADWLATNAEKKK